MERVVALTRLRKLLGKEMGWRINPNAATAEERADAKLKHPALAAAAQQAEKAMQDRRRAVLQGDQQYQELVAACREARKARADVGGLMHSYKITVGNTVAGMFFSVMAEGDSWEEVIDIVSKKK